MSTGLESLIDRRHSACQKFINRMKSYDYCHNNPLTDILNRKSTAVSAEHSYDLRFDRISSVQTNTDRFASFVTVKYFNS